MQFSICTAGKTFARHVHQQCAITVAPCQLQQTENGHTTARTAQATSKSLWVDNSLTEKYQHTLARDLRLDRRTGALAADTYRFA
jgi:hypothetical protein